MRRAGIGLEGRRELNHFEARIVGALCQRLSPPRGDNAPVTQRCESLRQPEQLPLSPAPPALRVNVENAKRTPTLRGRQNDGIIQFPLRQTIFRRLGRVPRPAHAE